MLARFFAVFFVVFSFISIAHADDDIWSLVASNKDDSRHWYIKKGSAYLSSTKNKKQSVVVAVFKFEENNNVDFGRYFVKTKDCDNQEGKINYANMDGNTVDTGDFVIGGGNINSTLAEELCVDYSQLIKYKKSKKNKN